MLTRLFSINMLNMFKKHIADNVVGRKLSEKVPPITPKKPPALQMKK